MNHEDLQASEIEWQRARATNDRMAPVYAVVALVAVSLLSVPANVAAAWFASGMVQYLLTAVVLAALFAPILVVILHSGRKVGSRGEQAMTTLEGQLRKAVQRSEHEGRLANALEMAEDEPEVLAVIERAFAATAPLSPIELLLADNSHAHLTRVATSSPTGEAPNCVVDSPDQCPAARRAQVQRFSDSEALDACPKLRARKHGGCSALCVPVSIMGRTVGVIHATSAPHTRFEEAAVHDLETLAKLAGTRIGLLRVLTETQLQASTDALTGLLNRRSLQTQVQALRRQRLSFVVAMADLDHFKQLNDVHGHETGDRALRVFAHTLRTSLRDHAIVSRQGGEEFAVVLPAYTVADASTALESVRSQLYDAVRASGLPAFTASFGIVEAADTEDLTEPLARADAALMHAKRAGRDCVIAHNPNGGPIVLEPPPPNHNGVAPPTNVASRRSPRPLVRTAPTSDG